MPVNISTSLSLPTGLNLTLSGSTLNVISGTTLINSVFNNGGTTNILGGTLVLLETGNPVDTGNYSLTGGTLQIDSDR